MKKWLPLLTLILFCAPMSAKAQDWTQIDAPIGLHFEGWVTAGAPVHGLVVDGNDRLWVCRLSASALLEVYNEDGSEAAFSPISDFGSSGVTGGNCRGINLDHEGNIIAVLDNSKIVRLNANTGAMIDFWEGPSSLTRPGVDGDGYVYIAPVAGSSPIRVLELPSYTESLTIQDESRGYTWWSRAVDVTPSGMRVASARLGGGLVVFESEDLTEYTMTDTLHTLFDFDASSLDFVSEDVVWVTDEGTDATIPELSTRNLKVFDFSDKTYYVLRADSMEINPRGLGFDSDGETVYVGSFGTGRVAKFTIGDPITSSVEGSGALPTAFSLEANFPNPFNHATAIRYTLNQPATVTLRVFDVTGRLVNTLVAGQMQAADSYRVDWNGTDATGRVLSSGTYFYTLEAGGERQTRAMVILK